MKTAVHPLSKCQSRPLCGIVFLCGKVLACALLGAWCGEVKGAGAPGNPFVKQVFATEDKSRMIRIISATEIEYSANNENRVGTYSQDGTTLRALFGRDGEKQAFYFDETANGLVEEGSRLTFYNAAWFKAMASRADADQRSQDAQEQARLANARKVFHAAMARGDKVITLNLHKGATMEFVLIPAGRFKMGRPGYDNPEPGYLNETVHDVTLSQPFYLGKYAVTQQQFDAEAGERSYAFKGPANPVDNVTWNDAVAYCAALSRLCGTQVTLPTEAQWEYACTPFAAPDVDKAYKRALEQIDNPGKPLPPEAKEPNRFGIYDSDEISQWCQDWSGHFTSTAQTDPQGPAAGTKRILRAHAGFRRGEDPAESTGGLRLVIPLK